MFIQNFTSEANNQGNLDTFLKKLQNFLEANLHNAFNLHNTFNQGLENVIRAHF
jgi:hypothetical protein